MDYEIKPERIDSKVVRVPVYFKDGSKLSFIRSGEGDIVREPLVGSCWIKDADYARIYRQVCAIFNEKF